MRNADRLAYESSGRATKVKDALKRRATRVGGTRGGCHGWNTCRLSFEAQPALSRDILG